MTELLEHAVQTARGLSPAMQDAIARLMLEYARRDKERLFEFSTEEAAELDEAEAAAALGDFATDAEVRALWVNYGL